MHDEELQEHHKPFRIITLRLFNISARGDPPEPSPRPAARHNRQITAWAGFKARRSGLALSLSFDYLSADFTSSALK